MESTKWLSVAASIWIQCSCGASYAFGIYSPILKSSQGYDQSTLDTVSVFKDIGANAGILSGLLYSAVRRRGHASPWVVIAAGAVQCFVGYSFMWLAVSGAIPRPHVALMCLFMFLAAHAQTFFSTANVVTAVQNFPDYSGTIVGIMKGFLGLSGAILIQVYSTLFAGKPSTFLLMLAVLPTLTSLSLMFLVRVHPIQPSNHDTKFLNGFSLISILVAAYLTSLIIINNTFPFMSQWARPSTLSVLLILLASPLTVVLKANNKTDHSSTPSSDNLKTVPFLTDIVDNDQDLNIAQAMSTLRFWLLFASMLCGMGSGLATINNISQIGESLGYSSKQRSTLVSLWSIWNFLGRFGAGYVSDVFLRERGLARPLFVAITLAGMAGGHVIIGSGFPGNLYVGSVIVGICYGSQWSLMPTITCEIFGVSHMGTIFNTIAVASPLGSYLFSVRVIGYIYDREGSGMGGSCSGAHCFMLSFLILGCVCFVGFLVALWLMVETRGIYARINVQRRIFRV